MFYDLEDPLKFVESITENLDDDGIWHLEQSYLPSMLKTKGSEPLVVFSYGLQGYLFLYEPTIIPLEEKTVAVL